MRSILNFGHPTDKPVRTMCGAGTTFEQDDTPIPAFYVITLKSCR